MNDILNTSGSTTGNQVLGRMRFHLPGKAVIVGQNGKTYSPDNEKTSTVASIADKYDNKLDEVNYYNG